MNEVQKVRIKNYRAWLIMLFIFPLFMPLLMITKTSQFLSFVFELVSDISDGTNDKFGRLIRLDTIIRWAEKNDKKEKRGEL